MKKRYIYSLLFGVPGFVVSLLVAFILFGFIAGFFWLYVYGDDPWPSPAETILPVLFVISFLTLWFISLVIGYVTGKRLEVTPDLSRNHVLVSIAATILPIVLVIFHQKKIRGEKTDSLLCGEYCSNKGYAASGMPAQDSGDRSCSCFDAAGKETVNVQLDSVSSGDYE